MDSRQSKKSPRSVTEAHERREVIVTMPENLRVTECRAFSSSDVFDKEKDMIHPFHVFEKGSTSSTTNDSCTPISETITTKGRVKNKRTTININQLCSDYVPLKKIPNCLFCYAKRFQYEPPGFCCGSGTVRLSSHRMPTKLKNLYMGNNAESRHFRTYIRTFNNLFAFRSLGVSCDKDLAKRNYGIYMFRVQRQMYHLTDDLYPKERRSNNLQLYFYDNANELGNGMACSGKLNETIVKELMDILKDNTYSIFLRSLSDMLNLQKFHIALKVMLDWINAMGTLQGLYDILRLGERDASNVGKQNFLPNSFIGGPRDMRQRYMDAIALVQYFDKPDLIITMTCNEHKLLTAEAYDDIIRAELPDDKTESDLRKLVIKHMMHGLCDEIEEYRSARWVSPPEAIWRLFGFPINEMSPSVYRLQLHLEGQQFISFKRNTDIHTIVNNPMIQKTMLTEFFSMNETNEDAKELNLLYKEFSEYFVWSSNDKFWARRQKHCVVGRIVTCHPAEGERCYLRLLLMHVRGLTSYKDLLIVNGEPCSTYREFVEKRGLLQCDNV
ncbi:uncharacterized protein [Nicotiana sylvestris]|uniref:uncharacterized protein n=1 Tax=Nicotiana sylvestris TaxID=4096 RepID=UPI00388CD519